MTYDALHKGYGGVSYRSKIGLHRTSQSGSAEYLSENTDPLWDVYIGPLPFLLAINDDRPHLRESTPARRERFDQGREPGENSLDSGIWLRSQTSWHLGAGQAYAEPLEEAPEVARFRFNASGGVDPWTPGQLSLLPTMEQLSLGYGSRQCIGVPGSGVVVSTVDNGVRKFVTSGASTELSSKVVNKLAASSTHWYGLSSAGLEFGLAAGGGEGGVAASGATALHWGKDRLWMAAQGVCYEFTDVAPTVLPTPHYTFRSGAVVDIDSGSGGVYWLVDDAFTSVYVTTVKDDGSLNPPREVTKLPRGETGNFLYCYLDRYLVIGTSAGVRVADCSSADSLAVGPLIVELDGGCRDAVGTGDFVYFTAGATGVVPTPDADPVPGLYRMDLSRQISSVSAYGDTAAARYPYATDMYVPDDTVGQAWSVTVYEGSIYMVAGGSSSDSPLWKQSTALVDSAWVESGQISFSTSESKAWTSFTLDVGGTGGSVYLTADTGAGYRQVTQTAVACPYIGDQDVDATSHPVSGWISHRVQLLGGAPVLQSVGLRAMPAPKRTRYHRLPLFCFDHQLDRNQVPVGYDGFGFDRLADLEALEASGAIVSVVDQRTGESVRAQIEKVSYEASAPPSRNQSNAGGFVTLTLLAV